MLTRLKKHASLLKRQLFLNQEITRLRKHNNQLLNGVLNAIQNTRANAFTDQERQLFNELEQYRARLLADNTVITYEVFNSDAKSTVRDICRSAASAPAWCKFHYSLSKETGARQFLEIGTNLGVSGTYIIAAIRDSAGAKLTTMEGLPQLCQIAGKQFSTLATPDKFEIIEGLYDHTFPALMSRPVQFDTIFIDGNHRKKPTLEYFDLLKKKSAEKTVYVFDDINWDAEMKEAWAEIQQDPAVNFALDLHKLGIVIVDKAEKARNVKANLFLAY